MTPTPSGSPSDAASAGQVTGADLSAIAADIGKGVPPAPARHNIAPDPPDGFVDISDIDRLNGFFDQPCNP